MNSYGLFIKYVYFKAYSMIFVLWMIKLSKFFYNFIWLFLTLFLFKGMPGKAGDRGQKGEKVKNFSDLFPVYNLM